MVICNCENMERGGSFSPFARRKGMNRERYGDPTAEAAISNVMKEDKMSKEWSKEFYASEAWHRCRLGYVAHRRAIDGGMCERCHKNLGYIVHHKRWLNSINIKNPEVSLNTSNLMYVCKDCHDIIHGYCNREIKRAARITFDDRGDPVRLPPSEGGE